MISTLTIQTRGQGLHDITRQVQEAVARAALREGLCTVFVQHTSASIIIQENADPAVQTDLEAWLGRLVAERDSIYTHNEEGPDDMPSHIRSALTATSVAVPIIGGKLALGTWQAIYLWEHRKMGRKRNCIVHIA